jgi:excisionase family DNA binding protein
MTSVASGSPATRPAPRPGRHTAPPSGAGARLLLTVEEAARCLGVGRTYMFQLISRGEVPSVRLGKLRRVKPEDLEAYVASL